MNLLNFSLEKQKLHASESQFKIDCDALNKSDLLTCASLLLQILPPFQEVHGIPSGGIRLAHILKSHTNKTSNTLLIVDDVVNTGTSLEEFVSRYRKEWNDNIIAACIFDRRAGRYDEKSLYSIFRLNPKLKDI